MPQALSCLGGDQLGGNDSAMPYLGLGTGKGPRVSARAGAPPAQWHLGSGPTWDLEHSTQKVLYCLSQGLGTQDISVPGSSVPMLGKYRGLACVSRSLTEDLRRRC